MSALAFSDLHLLTVLASTRSYTLAAKRMGIAKATVSLRIAELERAARVPLVRRTTRSVSLTPAGQQLVDDTRSAFEHIEQCFAGVRDLAGEPSGLLRVTAPVALGRQHIARCLPSFLRQYPEVRVELDLADRLTNLAQEGFDLAIRHTDQPPETYVAWPLCATRSLLVASRAYIESRGLPSHPQDLAGHDCLAYLRDSASLSWSFVRKANRRLERETVTVRGPLRANNSEVLREAVLAGLGIGLLPDFSAADELASASLVPLLPEWQPQGFFGGRIYAIRPSAAQVPRAVKCFVDHLRQELGAGFPLPAEGGIRPA